MQELFLIMKNFINNKSYRGEKMHKINKVLLLLITVLFFAGSIGVFALTKNYDSKADGKNGNEQIQRNVTNVFDLQRNTVSNIQFYTTNYGIFGLNIAQNIGGGVWPRGSLNQYIFGGGIWFAAVKKRPNSDLYKKYVEVTYNPNNGNSWMVPGRMNPDPDNHGQDAVDVTDIYRYQTYFSTDFRPGDGKSVAGGQYVWPVWDDLPDPDTLKKLRYMGHIIDDNTLRTTTQYPKGPAFISEEDIVSVFKDTDLSRFDGGKDLRSGDGYPLRIQFENYIYSWSFGQYKDFIFLRYDMINNSKDTLKECWMAPAMDIDIARIPNTQAGASNDRVRYYTEEPGLNLAAQWTNGDQGEEGKGFGYLGFNFLESPAVDEEGYIRKDKRSYTTKEQIGLKTFRNWVIADDINGDDARYNFMSSRRTDGDDGPGDKRFMMATGPFNMRPKDTVRVIVGVILANPSVRDNADGSKEDMAGLVEKTRFAQTVYDNNFRAPAPPERGDFNFKWTPLNNAIKLEWNGAMENSEDKYEAGLGFLGYKLFRARRPDLDSFDVNTIAPTPQNSANKGPFGWKQIAQWEMPTPFMKSVRRAGVETNNTNYPLIDSMRVAGMAWKNVIARVDTVIVGKDTTLNITWKPAVDTFGIKVLKVGKGIILAGPDAYVLKYMTNNNFIIPIIAGVDTNELSKPWGTYFKNKAGSTFPIYADPFKNYDTDQGNFASLNRVLKEDLYGTVSLNRALLAYNPLYWKKEATPLANPGDTAILPERVGDTINLKNTYRWINFQGVSQIVYDRMVPIDIYSALKDSLNIKQALDSVYSYIKRGLAKVSFPQMETTPEVRNVIQSYMATVTNNRTYLDVGDEDHVGTIIYNDDPTKTKKLLNNIDYYYKMLGYDEGDFSQPTPRKQNSASPGLPNFVVAYPRAGEVGKKAEFKVTYVDSARIGGLYNFKFFSTDDERVAQLFAGHELELEFQPVALPINITIPGRTTATDLGIYLRRMILKDLTTNQILFDSTTFFEETPCRYSGLFGLEGLFTENGASFYGADSLIQDTVFKEKTYDMGLPFSHAMVTRSGKITTGDFSTYGYCYAMDLKPPAYGTIGFAFNFTMQQYGGRFRPDSTSMNIQFDSMGVVTKPVDKTIINIIDVDATEYDPSKINTTQRLIDKPAQLGFYGMPQGWAIGPVRIFPVFGTFNNGPAVYKVTFLPGGTEAMDIQFGLGANKKHNKFTVPYLTMKVENVFNYDILDENGKTLKVRYPGEIKHMVIDSIPGTDYPTPPNLRERWAEFLDKYNLSAYAWVNGRGDNARNKLKAQQGYLFGFGTGSEDVNVGTQGRYYLSCKSDDGVDQIDFTHIFNGSGVQFAFDYANKGRQFAAQGRWISVDVASYSYGKDFAANDEVTLKTAGGASGMPLPGAKVRASISSTKPDNDQYTDDMMSKVKIVPNPYYITHQGQRSPYDAKIYFTKLPKSCTIDIYTVNGDLIRSMKHDETSADGPETHAVEVWDLLSLNKQRVQSQTLVAVIKSANGAQASINFTVIVGGFRLIQE